MNGTTRTVALLATAGLLLAACGREEEPQAEGTAEPESVAEGPAEGTVEVWAMGTEGEELGDFAAAFQEDNPDATVNVTAVPWDAAHDKIATAIAAGETPDVSLIGTTWMGEFGAGGGLDPTPTDLIDEGVFFESAWDSTVVQGTSYGVPWYVETRVLFYRTDLAEAAGYSEPPATWDDLKDMVSKIQAGGAQWGISLPPGGTGSWQTFLPFAWQNGAEVFDGEAFTLDTPEVTEALEFYKSFFDEGLSPNTVLEPGALESGFVDGSIGAFISGPWHVGLINEQGGPEFADKFAVAPLPEGEQSASFVGGGNLAVFADSDNRDAAWKFVQWLSEPETQQAWYETLNDLPAVSEAWESGALADDEVLAVFGEQLETAVAPPAVPTWEQVAAQIDAETERTVKGGQDPATATATMQSKADSIGTGF
ncbi:MAG: sugar ABC transporter substrate-binding protein [Jiangellaceae bacterium]|nr:sugar ABC transporter substrate-binding protein [Jiangellaceae bacterium]